MNIPGKLREDLKRIYGVRNPLDYIEDIVVTESEDETLLNVTLRVPCSCQKYVPHEEYEPLASTKRWSMFTESELEAIAEKLKEKENTVYVAKPKRVLFSGPKTIVFWPDGTKTMVSRMEGQEHDEYGAFCAAIVKKMFGATHKAQKFLESVKAIQAPKKVKSEEPDHAPVPRAADIDWVDK